MKKISKFLLIIFLFLGSKAFCFNLSGTYYFDNSQTQWSNVYMFVGHGSYLISYPMNAGSNDVYSYNFASAWNGATAVFFANGDGGLSGGSGSYNVTSTTYPTNNISSRTTANYNIPKLYSIPYQNSGITIPFEWRTSLDCPASVLDGTDVMLYFRVYSGGAGTKGLTNGSCPVIGTPTNFINQDYYQTFAVSSFPSKVGITNNCSSWSGTTFTSQTASNAAGAFYQGDATNTKTNGTSFSVSASATSICSGTPSINLTATTGGTTSSYGRKMYVLYYLDGATSYNVSTGRISSTTTVTSFNTSSLSLGAHTIIPVLTDRLIHVIGSPITITVTASGTWTGSVNTDWGNATNWSCGTLPTSSTDVIIPSGTTYSPTISASAVAKTVTINSGATLNGGSGTLTIASGGKITNNGTYTKNAETIIFSGAGTVDGSNAITFYNLTINSGTLTLTKIPTIDGTLQINNGNLSAAPYYTANSTLLYNVNYNRYVEWNATGVGTLGTTAGYPNNVTVNTGTLNLVNSDAGTSRALAGNLTINTGATCTTNALNAAFTVGGNLVINGTGYFNMSSTNTAVTVKGSVTVGDATSSIGKLALSTSAGGNLYIGGNYTVGTSSTVTNNGRTVYFNGSSGNQVITKTGGGTIYFDYLVIDKPSGDIQLSGSAGQTTNVWIKSIGAANSGNYQLELKSGGVDLNGQTFTYEAVNALEATENTTNIKITGANERIYTSSGTGDFIFSGNYSAGKSNAFFLFSPDTNTLTFDSNVTLQTSVGVDFGTNGKTLINSIFQINQYGFVINNSPKYGSSSTLIYNNGSAGFYRNVEWNSNSGAGYPNNVIIRGSNNTKVELDGAARPPAFAVTKDIGCSGDLTIESGATLKLNNMAYDLYVAGNINLAGSLQQATTSGADIYLNGNWAQSGSGALTGNSRTVIFNKQSDIVAQTISGSTTFDNITLNNSAGLNCIGATDNNTVNQNLTLTNGKITLNTNNLIIGASGDITNYSDTRYIVTNNTGELKRTLGTDKYYPVGSETAYNPIKLSNNGTTDVYGIRTIYGDITDAKNLSDPNDYFDSNAVLKLKWQITEAVSGGSILTPEPEWNFIDQGSNFSACSASVNLYNGDYTWLN